MPENKKPAKDARTIAIRVSPEVWQVLDAARTLRGHRGMQDLLLPVIEAEADQWRDLEEVRTILRSVREFQAREAGELERLPKERRRGKGQN